MKAIFLSIGIVLMSLACSSTENSEKASEKSPIQQVTDTGDSAPPLAIIKQRATDTTVKAYGSPSTEANAQRKVSRELQSGSIYYLIDQVGNEDLLATSKVIKSRDISDANFVGWVRRSNTVEIKNGNLVRLSPATTIWSDQQSANEDSGDDASRISVNSSSPFWSKYAILKNEFDNYSRCVLLDQNGMIKDGFINSQHLDQNKRCKLHEDDAGTSAVELGINNDSEQKWSISCSK